jgi:transposase
MPSLAAPEGGAVKQPSEAWRDLAELAESLGNICEACRRMGLSRHFYYLGVRKWGIPAGGPEGAGGKSRKRHPHAVPPALEREILTLARERPEWGCDRIAFYLKLEGKPVSPPTVQKILVRHGLGKRSQRPGNPTPIRTPQPGGDRPRQR